VGGVVSEVVPEPNVSEPIGGGGFRNSTLEWETAEL
jgi:hypothetical protein